MGSPRSAGTAANPLPVVSAAPDPPPKYNALARSAHADSYNAYASAPSIAPPRSYAPRTPLASHTSRRQSPPPHHPPMATSAHTTDRAAYTAHQHAPPSWSPADRAPKYHC